MGRIHARAVGRPDLRQVQRSVDKGMTAVRNISGKDANLAVGVRIPMKWAGRTALKRATVPT
jgi:hypothetical protein